MQSHFGIQKALVPQHLAGATCMTEAGVTQLMNRVEGGGGGEACERVLCDHIKSIAVEIHNLPCH